MLNISKSHFFDLQLFFFFFMLHCILHWNELVSDIEKWNQHFDLILISTVMIMATYHFGIRKSNGDATILSTETHITF